MINDNKVLLFGDEARSKIKNGVDTLANAVKVTMGPSGQNVVIERPGQAPHLTKDGVTVANSINLRGRFENLGVQIVKEAAARTADEAGDGTTTSTVLSQCIFTEGTKLIAAGYNVAEIKTGIKLATEAVIGRLQEMSTEVTKDEEIVQVGTVSANGDNNIGNLLCDAMNAVGTDGVITVEEAKGFKTSLEVVEGTQIDRGFLSPYFVTNQSAMTSELEDCYVLLCNTKITSLKKIVPLLEELHQTQKSLLIVASDVDGDALQGLVVNKMKGTLKVCAIRSPEFGDNSLSALNDIAALIGCKEIVNVDEEELADLTLDKLGFSKKVIVHKNKTLFVSTSGDKDKISSLISELRNALHDNSLSDHERSVLKRRIRRLTGSVAVLRVGGATEVEMKERKDRVEDALHATQAAVDEGILPGGGVALVRASKAVDETIRQNKLSNGTAAGASIVKDACYAPLLQIVNNTGVSPQVVLEKVARQKNNNGYNASTGDFVDMFTAGVIDPTKVVRFALEHASSAAVNLLSIGCSIVQDENSNENSDTLMLS